MGQFIFSRRSLFWIAFLLLCGLLGGLKTWQNVRFRDAQVRQQAEVQEMQARDQRAMRQALVDLHELLARGLPRPSWSKEDLESHLPGNPRLELDENVTGHTRKTATWTHPTATVEAEFRFDAENRLQGWDLRNSRLSREPTPLSYATFENVGEQLRWAIAKYGKWLWPAALFAWLVAFTYRQTLGDLLLAIAIACAVADIGSPRHTLLAVFSNDAVFFDALMFAISCAAVAVTSRPLRSFVGRRVLPRQFSIRWIMAFTALIAALVAMGWYGKVVGSVLAVAAIAYVVMSLIERRPAVMPEH